MKYIKMAVFKKVFRFVSTKKSQHIVSKRFFSSQTSSQATKENYYKNLGTQQDDSKPEGWDKALPFEKIPGPKPLPILGNFWRFALPFGDFYNIPMIDMQKKLYSYGNVTIMKGLPGQPDMIFLFDPSDMETLYRNEGVWPMRDNLPSIIYYRNVYRKDLFGENPSLLFTQGEEWFKFRSTVNPILMQPRIVQQYVSSMDLIADEFVDNIRYLASLNDKGEMPEDFTNEINKWAMESISIVALDKRLGCLKRGLSKDSEQLIQLDYATSLFDLMFKLDMLPNPWRYVSTPTWKQFVKALDFINDVNMKHIDDAMKKIESSKSEIPEHEMSVLHKLLRKNRSVAISMVLDMLTAGIDTTGRTIAAALYYLAKNPDKQAKLREEARKILPNKNSPLTKDLLPGCVYTKAVIKETSRLAPVALGNRRTSMKKMVLGGYQIPKGTEIVTANFLTSNLDKYFPQPEKFMPERWLRSQSDEFSHKNVNLFVYLPFGFGPRSCVGKRIANLEMETVLIKIVRNFELSWPHKDMTFKSLIFYGIADPLKLHVKEVED